MRRGWAWLVALVLAASVAFSGCCWLGIGTGCDHPCRPPAEPSTGSVVVTVGHGAVASSPYECKGSGTVTLRSGSGEVRPATYAHTGWSGLSAPACRATLVFADLSPGTWTVEVSPSGARCQRLVEAGGRVEVLVRTDVGSCQ